LENRKLGNVPSARIAENPLLSAAAVKLNDMTKKQIRETVFKKYDGKCAYCGIELIKGWHVDHINPKVYGGKDDLENLNPSCKDCNNYKCHSQLETFRMYAKQMFNERLDYLFKSKVKMQVAINMGVITHKEWDGIFYYERVGSSCR
jgi:hypothetical protein